MGFEEATQIQEQAIPVILNGRDVIGQAQTGTGKTVAFGIPMIEKCDGNSRDIQGVVITPTRELAIQVSDEINKIGQHKGIRALPIYGGQDYRWQMKGLSNGPQIIVGTPGRLIDHIVLRKTIKIDRVSILVLDEADEMLDMGFRDDLETILRETPASRQTLLFSATMSDTIKKLARKYMKDPFSIVTSPKKLAVPAIEQRFVEIHESDKFEALCRILDFQCPELAIVFGRTRKRVDELQDALNKRGYSARGLHGDLDQSKRNSIMKLFKEGTVQILVATDVAARGLDVTGVTHVFNFDIPQDAEGYVHRIGRTGRAGKSGMSISFVTPREFRLLKIIEQVAGQRITRLDVPTADDAIKGQQRLVIDGLMEVANSEEALKYATLAEMLLEKKDSVTIISAALKLLIKEPDKTPIVLSEVKAAKARSPRSPRTEREGRSGHYESSGRESTGYRQRRQTDKKDSGTGYKVGSYRTGKKY